MGIWPFSKEAGDKVAFLGILQSSMEPRMDLAASGAGPSALRGRALFPGEMEADTAPQLSGEPRPSRAHFEPPSHGAVRGRTFGGPVGGHEHS